MTNISAQKRLEEGERMFLLGRLADAQEIFESIIHEGGPSKEAYNNLGVIAYRHGELEKAFHCFMNALRIDPRYQDGLENLSHLRGKLKKNLSPVERCQATDPMGSVTALRTASESLHHLTPDVRLVTNRKEYFVDYCKSKSVLHIGCVGSGSVEERLRDGSHLHYRLSKVTSSLAGIDINAEGVAALKKAGFDDCLVRDIERDETVPEVATNTDVILIPEVMEHLSNPGLFLDRLRNLNYRGEILVSVPNAFSYRSASFLRSMGVEFVHPDHHFYFSPTTLRTLFEKHGFSVLTLALYYWPSKDEFGRVFESVLQKDPYMAEGIIAHVRDSRRVQTPIKRMESFSAGRRSVKAELESIRDTHADRKPSTPYKLYYSPGIKHHGENARLLLNLEHYLPSLDSMKPVWFFGLYFDCDYYQVRAHVGKKIINWRGADTLRLVNHSERLRLIERTEALHVCQAQHQKEILSRHGIRSIVRPMMNTPFRDIRLSDFPAGPTDILVYWRRGDDRYIQADLFFEIAARCPDTLFHVVGEEDPKRFQRPGMNNILFHGFIPEDHLDKVMDRCKGTIRPWVWDGNPNIQTKMLLKGRYAAHSCRFEKVSHCTSVEDYVAWIEWLRGVEAPNLEAREWWMEHLNNFDFLDPGFDPAKQDSGGEA